MLTWTKDTLGDLSTDLIGAYNFDENGDDISDLGNDCTPHGSPTYDTEGGVNVCVLNSSLSQYFEGAAISGLGGSAFSVCFLVYVSAYSGTFRIVSADDADNRAFSVYMYSGKIGIDIGGAGFESTSGVPTDGLHQVVLTFNPSTDTIKCYLDGEANGETTEFSGGLQSSSASLQIGRRNYGGSPDGYCNLKLGPLYLWKRELSETNAADLFNSGSYSFVSYSEGPGPDYFPYRVLTFRTLANRSGVDFNENKETVLFAEDVQKLIDEIIDIENYLLS